MIRADKFTLCYITIFNQQSARQTTFAQLQDRNFDIIPNFQYMFTNNTTQVIAICYIF